MDDPRDKREQRSGTYYFPGVFRYFLIYVYTTEYEAGKEEDLQRIMDRLNKTTTEYGMKIKTKKTKVMKISRVEGEEKNMKITIDGEEIEQITKFCYLGSLITDNAKCHKEINKRIATGKESFTKRKELLKGGLK